MAGIKELNPLTGETTIKKKRWSEGGAPGSKDYGPWKKLVILSYIYREREEEEERERERDNRV